MTAAELIQKLLALTDEHGNLDVNINLSLKLKNKTETAPGQYIMEVIPLSVDDFGIDVKGINIQVYKNLTEFSKVN